jgi:hypothetical protein
VRAREGGAASLAVLAASVAVISSMWGSDEWVLGFYRVVLLRPDGV